MGTSINLKLGTSKAARSAGTADASAVEMERRVITIRWLAILVCSGALPFLNLGKSLVPLLALIGIGALYNLAIQVYILPRRPGWLTRGYVSAIGDVLLVTGGVAVTGGITSPFFLAYFAVTVTSAVRFGGVAADEVRLQGQMPALSGQDESTPAASMLYVDWNPELKAAHAAVDLTTARLALTPAPGEQVITVSEPNLLLPNEHKALPAGLWFRVPVFHGARAIADMIVGFTGR